MQCLVLAGGLGTRMKSVSGDKPKALLPVGSQTFIDYQLQWLKILGISDVVMALGHGGEEIKDHIESKQTHSSYPQVNYSFDGPKLLGTGGAVRKALPMLSKDFVVTYGDTMLFLNLKKMMSEHYNTKRIATMSILKNKNIGDKSNVIYSNGKIELYDKFNLKPEMEYIDYGMLLLNKEHFTANTSKTDAFDLATYLTELSKKSELGSFISTQNFKEVGSPSGYQEFCKFLNDHNYNLKEIYKMYVDTLDTTTPDSGDTLH